MTVKQTKWIVIVELVPAEVKLLNTHPLSPDAREKEESTRYYTCQNKTGTSHKLDR